MSPQRMADLTSPPCSEKIGPIEQTANKRTQFRLRFEKNSDGNNANDMLFSDVETQPKLAELEVTYEYP